MSRNIPTATASRRVEESKVDLRKTQVKRCWHPETYLRLRRVEESKVDLRLKNSINSVNSIRHSFATTEARTNQNTDPESHFPARHIKTTNKAPQSMVLEISQLFRLKSEVPKWPCHSTYIFIAIIFVHRTWHLHWRVSSSWVDSDFKTEQNSQHSQS